MVRPFRGLRVQGAPVPGQLPARIPALTLRQPWAWAIAYGSKGIENRGRRMNYRGPVWLHAGARSRWDPAGEDSPLVRGAWVDCARSRPDARELLNRRTSSMDFGAVIALVTITGCHHWTDCRGTCSPWAAEGCFHIELGEHVTCLPQPVPCRGALGLWGLSAADAKGARDQLAGLEIRP